jgi:uncharacterized protein (DUF2225 family)
MDTSTKSRYTYQDEWECPLCRQKFKLTRFRNSRLRVIKRDADHHQWYADDQHPVRFYVVICPHCGYAAGENHFLAEDNAKPRRRSAPIGLTLTEDLNIDRSDDARVAACFGHAIRQMINSKVPASILAGISLRGAWFCREIDDQEQERIMLQLSYKQYEIAYEKEPLPIGPMTRLGLTYLLGELARRIEDYQHASFWFGEAARLREDQMKEPLIAKLLAEQHELLREEYRKNANPDQTSS